MKKWISLCLLAVCLLTIPAMADVIWEPDDDFYSSHRDQCDYLGRSYHVNGPQGGTALWRKEPGGGHVRVLENGTRLYISFTYADQAGTVWGVTEYGGGTGWVDMEDLLLIYDNQSFTEEYEAEFFPYDDSFRELCTSEDQRVIIWTYPGSGEINCDFDALSQNYSALQPDVTWTDGEGRVWGRIGYYMAARGWVCLSDPGNDTLPVTERTYDLYPVGDLSQIGRAPAAFRPAGLLLACLGVAAVCGITAVLLFRMRKKNH